jgi:hypothetical protein
MQCIYKKISYLIVSTVVYLVTQQSACGRGFDIHDEIGSRSTVILVVNLIIYLVNER